MQKLIIIPFVFYIQFTFQNSIADAMEVFYKQVYEVYDLG